MLSILGYFCTVLHYSSWLQFGAEWCRWVVGHEMWNFVARNIASQWEIRCRWWLIVRCTLSSESESKQISIVASAKYLAHDFHGCRVLFLQCSGWPSRPTHSWTADTIQNIQGQPRRRRLDHITREGRRCNSLVSRYSSCYSWPTKNDIVIGAFCVRVHLTHSRLRNSLLMPKVFSKPSK